MQPFACATHRGILKTLAVDFDPDALHEDLLVAAEKEVAPQHRVRADHEVRFLIAPRPGESRGLIVSQPLFPKRHLSQMHDQP